MVHGTQLHNGESLPLSLSLYTCVHAHMHNTDIPRNTHTHACTQGHTQGHTHTDACRHRNSHMCTRTHTRSNMHQPVLSITWTICWFQKNNNFQNQEIKCMFSPISQNTVLQLKTVIRHRLCFHHKQIRSSKNCKCFFSFRLHYNLLNNNVE